MTPVNASDRLPSTQHHRPTIGFLTTDMQSYNAQQMWRGVVDVADEHDINTICIVGGYLEGECELDQRSNVLYQLVNQGNVDALIARGYLSSSMTPAREQAFYGRFAPSPIVVMGRPLQHFPYVLMDSYIGMYEAVAHLIEDHAYRRLAFLRGPEFHDAEERYRAFVDALRDHHIDLEPELVTERLPGDWNSYDLDTLMDWFFDHVLGHADTIVAASAGMALAFVHALRGRNIRVPEDITIIGFDYGGEWALSPLTTVDGRHYDQARYATSMILDLLAGRPIQQEVILPTRLIVRESCGCRSPQVTRAYVQPPTAEGAIDAGDFGQVRQYILSAVDCDPYHAARLVDAMFADLKHDSARFITTLEALLLEVTNEGGPISIWQDFISELRRVLLPYLPDRSMQIKAENLWQQARVTIARSMELAQARQVVETQRHMALVQEISQALNTTFDVSELADMLADVLPRLEIPSAFLVLYDSPVQPAYRAQIILAYIDYQRIDLKPIDRWFSTTQLIPPTLLPASRRYHLIVESLYFQNDQIGFAVFEMGPQTGGVYDMLRAQLSAALKGAELFTRNVELYKQARVAQGMAEEANRLKSRFLAMVSHELRTPVNLLVGLSEMLLEKQGSRIPKLPEPYLQDLEHIHVSAAHLDSLLRDVMDLAHSQVGKLQLTFEPIAVAELLNEVASVASVMAQKQGLMWHTDIPENLPGVYGDAARLKQVTLNLVHNAIKFTSQGYVKLGAEVTAHEVVIHVRDTGLGIPVNEQALIFDEFQTSGRTAARGFAGLGLGLAISRRLVEQHGGSIGVESPGEEGGGSMFYFSLPIMQAAALAPISESQPVILLLTTLTHAEPMQALQVDDYAVYTMEVRDDDPTWFEKVVASSAQAIVLNISPESQQGWQILKRLKQHPITQDLPVLFYSMLENQGSLLLMDYLEKPLNKTILSRALARYGLAKGVEQSTILVVDDEEQTLNLHVRAVQAQLPACRVLRAVNGHEALELMVVVRPNLVLLDLMMPELDGFGVLSAMQDDPDLRQIPVIVLTAMMLTSAEMDYLNERVARVLSKGIFRADEIVAQIARVLARNVPYQSISQRTIQYIHQNFKKAISRADMAHHACVSERHLDRCFQHDLGMTPVAYLNRYRLQQAKNLLEEGNLSMAQIATAVGFSNVTQLGRAFRREFGISPSAYQRGDPIAP